MNTNLPTKCSSLASSASRWWRLAPWAGLLWLAAGCETVQDYSLTCNLWQSEGLRRFCEPAPQPNLALFDAQDRKDVLVQYDALTGRHDTVKRRAYFMDQSCARISARKKPQFVDPALAGNLSSVPLFETASELANGEPQLYAVMERGGREFTLYRRGARPEACELPVYVESSSIIPRVAVTPLAVAVDGLMVGAVAALEVAAAMAASGTSFTIH